MIMTAIIYVVEQRVFVLPQRNTTKHQLNKPIPDLIEEIVT